ncbi:MAG TPA: pyridoxal-phosphate dependent enzyme, partial [Aeromonadales bacterium]|nr:pyridoxal-phosphate dependent enzyme [Aeromonadales bacterium]
DENNYVKLAGRIAEEMDNAVWANQFDNTANRDAHYQGTGPEIWQQTEGALDGFICATGTGGTLAGISRYLKEQNNKVTIGLADPHGSALAQWALSGELSLVGDGSITEGIGNGRITANLADTVIDKAVSIDDQTTVNMVYHLLNHEGLLLGASSALNVVAALWLAKELGPGHTIATILCDSGIRYQSRLFNENWLNSKGLSMPSSTDRFDMTDLPQ